MNCYVGIDPGKSGSIVAIDPAGLIVFQGKPPVIGTKYDIGGMIQIIRDVQNIGGVIQHAVLESIHANVIGSKASNFDLGFGLGVWATALHSCGVSYSMIPPQTWQKGFFTGLPKQMKPKEKALTIATRLLPDENWYHLGARGQKLTNIDDGKVDAYLLAEYARRFIK